MKADPFVQLALLDLQALDSALDWLAHRRRTLPELAEIDRLTAQTEMLRDGVVRGETEVLDLARETSKIEGEVEQVRSRKARDEQRLSSGAITNPKQLQDLEHEVATLARRQSDLEDIELEVMERAETALAALTSLTQERDGHQARRAEAEAARDESWAAIDEETAQTSAARADLAASLPADLLALYEKIRAAEGGVGAGAIGRGQCGACRLDLMGNEITQIRAAAPDDVLRHEECQRIIVRTAESGL